MDEATTGNDLVAPGPVLHAPAFLEVSDCMGAQALGQASLTRIFHTLTHPPGGHKESLTVRAVRVIRVAGLTDAPSGGEY